MHLTDATIKRLPAPAKGNRITYDVDVPGFGCRVTAAGTRSFVLNYMTRGGRERRHTIGQFPDWSTTAARARARELRRLIDDGGDPLADIESERKAASVGDLIKRFEAEHLPRLRASSQADYRRDREPYQTAFWPAHQIGGRPLRGCRPLAPPDHRCGASA